VSITLKLSTAYELGFGVLALECPSPFERRKYGNESKRNDEKALDMHPTLPTQINCSTHNVGNLLVPNSVLHPLYTCIPATMLF
jgi:hypothetical protein